MGTKKSESAPSAFRGDGSPFDRCTCDHERDLHLSDQCVGCADRFGCRGFTARPAVDRAAVIARITGDLATLDDFALETAERQTAILAHRPMRRP